MNGHSRVQHDFGSVPLNSLLALNPQVRYFYEHPVTVLAPEIILRPAPHCRSPVHAHAF